MRIVLLGAALWASLGTAAIAQSPAIPPAAPDPPAVAGSSPAAQPSIDRACANYETILRGQKTLFDLTPAEQDEVRALDRRVRAQQPPDHSDSHERCLDDAYARLGRQSTALDQRTIETGCR